MILPLMACSIFDLLKCDDYEDGLPLEVCKNIILQTLLGVKELEKHNLMHTDLKPENILVCGLNREAEIDFYWCHIMAEVVRVVEKEYKIQYK
jgi:serine/threonine protein kinase